MKKFSGCLLVSDVDGTLIEPGGIPKGNIAAIKYFIENGGKFTLATGRCCDAVRELLRSVPINAPALITNGVVLYDFEREEVVRSTGIDDKTKSIILDYIDKKDPDIGIEIHSRDKVCDVSVTHEIDLHNRYEDLHPVEWDDEQIKNAEWSKVFFSFEKIEDREMLRQKLISLGICESQIMFTNAYLADGIHNYLELVPAGCDKGTGVRALAEELGIADEFVFGIGDYYNDIPLLKAVGCAGVVKGAPDEITALADFVSCPVAEGAVGRFIEYIEERIQGK